MDRLCRGCPSDCDAARTGIAAAMHRFCEYFYFDCSARYLVWRRVPASMHGSCSRHAGNQSKGERANKTFHRLSWERRFALTYEPNLLDVSLNEKKNHLLAIKPAVNLRKTGCISPRITAPPVASNPVSNSLHWCVCGPSFNT